MAPIVELTSAGTYTITLRVAIPDKDACPPDELEFTIEVFEEPTVDVGTFGQACAGNELLMEIVSVADGGTPITGWLWDLDGSTIGTVQQDIPVTFPDPGEFVVTATATNLCGSHSDDINITVDSIPDVQFELPDLPGYCAGDTLLVIATGAETYTWANSVDFAEEADLHSHCIPVVPGDDVSLSLSSASANGCTTSDTLEIEIRRCRR